MVDVTANYLRSRANADDQPHGSVGCGYALIYGSKFWREGEYFALSSFTSEELQSMAIAVGGV